MSNALLLGLPYSSQINVCIDDIFQDALEDAFRISDDDHSFQDKCTICLERPFNSLHPPQITNCKHKYHSHCIIKWLQLKKQCPVCWQHLVPCSSKEKKMASDVPSNEVYIPNVLLFQGTNRIDKFEILHPIGYSNCNMAHVYKAICISTISEQQDAIPLVYDVAVKCVSRKHQPMLFRNLRHDVSRNNLIPYHPNIIKITKSFDYNGYYCVVFPLTENPSLRSVMHDRFPKGFPEECIVIALKEILTAVHFIHRNHVVDVRITAGNTFFTGNKIKLAFSASDFEDINQSFSYPSSRKSYMPMSCISNWANGLSGSSLEPHTHKDDIWWIGITALELAYGGVWVSSREDLRDKLFKARMSKQLPNCSKKENGIKMLRSFLFRDRNFSRSFQKMVMSCLSYWPKDRPNIKELMAFDIFAKCDKDMTYFSQVVGSENNTTT